MLADSTSPDTAASGDAFSEQAADHGSVQQADGDQRNEKGEREERAVEDTGVVEVAGHDAFVDTGRSKLTVFRELVHLSA